MCMLKIQHFTSKRVQEHNLNWFFILLTITAGTFERNQMIRFSFLALFSWYFDHSMVLRDRLARHLGRPVIYWRFFFALDKNQKYMITTFHLKSMSSSCIFHAFKLSRSYLVKVICYEILHSIKLYLTPFLHAVQFVGNTPWLYTSIHDDRQSHTLSTTIAKHLWLEAAIVNQLCFRLR